MSYVLFDGHEAILVKRSEPLFIQSQITSTSLNNTLPLTTIRFSLSNYSQLNVLKFTSIRKMYVLSNLNTFDVILMDILVFKVFIF